MSIENKEVLLLNQEINSKIKKIELKEKKRSLALFNIFSELMKIDDNLNKNYQNLLNVYDSFIPKIGLENDQIINGHKDIIEEELENSKLFNKENIIKNENKEIAIDDYYYTCLINSSFRYDPNDYEAIIYLKSFFIDESEKFDINNKNYKIIIKFNFKENPFFENELLEVKAYYENNIIKKTQGTNIKWKNKNLSYEEVEVNKKIRNSSRFRTKKIKKKVYSFFNIFDNYYEDDKLNLEKFNEENPCCTLLDIEKNINELRDIIFYSLEHYLDIDNEKLENIESPSKKNDNIFLK